MSEKSWIDKQIAARPNEAKIVRRVVRALAKAGTPVVRVHIPNEQSVLVNGERDVLEEVFNLDDAYLMTADESWVFLTMGEGWDILNDYTLTLEDALKPVNDWIMKRS